MIDKPRQRGIRRAVRGRLKSRRAAYYSGVHAYSPQRLGGLIDTPTPCSCWMCTSPRKRGELTRQEIRVRYVEGDRP